jgi:hypothetical protein
MERCEKKVLLLAPPFYALHDQIRSALEKQCYKVTFIPDLLQKYNPNFSTSSLASLKKTYYNICQPNLRYLNQYQNEANCEYDYFVCINGYSFHPSLLKSLRRVNSNIKAVLYLWDGLSFFDFSKTFSYFDSIFTFDYKDALEKNIKYLPLYWIRNKRCGLVNDKKYDLSFIGTLHSDRFRLISKIVSQCNDLNLKYFIKLVYRERKLSLLDSIRYMYYKKKNNPSAIAFIDEFKILQGNVTADYLCNTPLSSKDVESVIENSRCVLDVELPYQTGLTNRMISSMGNGKKVITTNKAIKDTPLWDENNICCIDRETPVLDSDFIYSDYIPNPVIVDYLGSLRIDNWIKTLLNG